MGLFKRKTPEYEANTAADWADGETWRTWDPPRDIVAGEQMRQSELWRVVGEEPGKHGKLVPVPVTFVRDAANQYDPNAVKAVIAGEHIGFLRKELAGAVSSEMDTAQASSFGMAGVVRGGGADADNRRLDLGVHVWTDRRLTVGPVETIRTTEYGVGWPPHPREGKPDDWGCPACGAWLAVDYRGDDFECGRCGEVFR